MEILGILGSGEEVVDRPQTHLHPEVITILPEALRMIQLHGEQFVEKELDFGRVIGQTNCVETNDSDKVVYAKRKGRQGYSRFVKNRELEDSSKIVIVLKRAEEGNSYLLITAFIGSYPGPEPWDLKATEQSREYWKRHALVWGSAEIDPETETSLCSW